MMQLTVFKLPLCQEMLRRHVLNFTTAPSFSLSDKDYAPKNTMPSTCTSGMMGHVTRANSTPALLVNCTRSLPNRTVCCTYIIPVIHLKLRQRVVVVVQLCKYNLLRHSTRTKRRKHPDGVLLIETLPGFFYKERGKGTCTRAGEWRKK